MSTMRHVAPAFLGLKLTVALLRICWWLAETTYVGCRTSIRAIRLLPRIPKLTSETLRCPRGDEEPVFGVWECQGCHATFEGWAFQKCPMCGLGARWIPCSQCGLPVEHPVPELL